MTLLGPPNQISKKGKGPSGVKRADVNKIAQPPDHCPNNGCRLRKYFDFRSSTTVQVLFSIFYNILSMEKPGFDQETRHILKKKKAMFVLIQNGEAVSRVLPPGSGCPANRGNFSSSCLALIDLVVKVSYLFIYLFYLFVYLLIYLFIYLFIYSFL